MQQLTEFLEEHADAELLTLSGIYQSSDPSIIGASLAAVFCFYDESIDDSDYKTLTTVAIERIFKVIANAASEDSEEFQKFLYRIAFDHVAKRIDYFYKARQKEFPDSVRTYRLERNFPWKVVYNQKSATSPHEFEEFTALKLFGYTVGKTQGWPTDKRHRFLTDFMEHDLPSIVKHYFRDQYGEPMSVARLRKVANILAGNISLRINQRTNFSHAIADWANDLSFLKLKYYEGKNLKFQPWPNPI